MISIANKISSTTSTATIVSKIKAGTLRMYGSNLAVLGNIMDAAGWKAFAAGGQNWGRAHHLATALRSNWMTVPQVSMSWDQAKSNGVRISIDLVENLGEVTPWGLYGFKEKLCQFDPEAEKILEEYIQDIEELLKHPALFMVGIINECGQFLTPETMRKLRARWLPIIKAYNSKVMVYTTNDVHVQETEFIHAVAEEDCFCINFYPTEDFNTDVKCSWVNEAWHLEGLKWLVNWLRSNGTPKPVLITEFGSWNVNPFYLENELCLNLTAAKEGWSTAQYAYSTGSDTDKYSDASDESRLKGLIVGGLINKNRASLATAATATNVTAAIKSTREAVQAGGFVFRTDPCPEWARLTKSL